MWNPLGHSEICFLPLWLRILLGPWNSLHLAPGWGKSMEDIAWEIFMGQDWKYPFTFHWLESSHMALSNWKRAEKCRLSMSSGRRWKRFGKVLASFYCITFQYLFSFFLPQDWNNLYLLMAEKIITILIYSFIIYNPLSFISFYSYTTLASIFRW